MQVSPDQVQAFVAQIDNINERYKAAIQLSVQSGGDPTIWASIAVDPDTIDRRIASLREKYLFLEKDYEAFLPEDKLRAFGWLMSSLKMTANLNEIIFEQIEKLFKDMAQAIGRPQAAV